MVWIIIPFCACLNKLFVAETSELKKQADIYASLRKKERQKYLEWPCSKSSVYQWFIAKHSLSISVKLFDRKK